MQKALILALLIGAFLLPRYVTAQETTPVYSCPDGGTFVNHEELGPICSNPAPFGTPYMCSYGSDQLGEVTKLSQCMDMVRPLVPKFSGSQSLCYSGEFTRIDSATRATVGWEWRTQNSSGLCNETIQQSVGQAIITPLQPRYYCPPDDYPKLLNFGGEEPNFFCWQLAVNEEQDCPTEPGPNPIFYIGEQGGGTACIEEDNGSICPYVEDPNLPGYYTADFSNPQSCAGQQPEEPDLKPDCTEGGNGMTVCKADPDDKCTVNSTGLLSCEANCGYINGQFYCPEEPDVPEIPDPEISDDIQDPNKPLGDMVKQDFKDVLIGAETRLSSIKKELEDVQLRNDKNTDKLSDKLTGIGAKIDQVNRNLVGIQGTLDETLYGDELTIDSSGFQDEINQGLGVTGDESLEDLEGEPISLDDFTGNFQFSLGNSACPADRQINIRGKAYSISWQPFCDVFSFIGVLVQISAYVLSLFIVFGGRK